MRNLSVVAVYDTVRSAPAVRLADDLGIFTTTEITELYQIGDLDLVLDLSEDWPSMTRSKPSVPAVSASSREPAPSSSGIS